MSASPEFFKPAAPVFSPTRATQPPLPLVLGADDNCRTPTGSAISYLKEPTTCPPAPRRKPPQPQRMCRKRLFQHAQAQAAAQPDEADQHQHISLRLDELERIFRPHPPPATTNDDKRHRCRSSPVSASGNKQSG